MMKPCAVYILQCAPVSALLPLDCLPLRAWPRALVVRLQLVWYALRFQLYCWWSGQHHIVRAPWIGTDTNEVAGYDVGCSRCTLLWYERADGTRVSDPRMVFLDSP